MRILHTSDWHIGRTFHGHSTLPFVRQVLDALVSAVTEHGVDVVVAAGDVFDSAMPSAEAYRVLTETLVALRAAGAIVVLTSGNHDSATRLGFQSQFAALGGVHVLTERTALREPVSQDGVHLYGVPYLEPALVKQWWPEVTTHDDAVAAALAEVRADWAERGGRAVVMAHCFVVGVRADGPEKDITAGGLQYVSLDRFAGFDYVALGHIHSAVTLRENIRYCGAPLHYSFSEAGRKRGAWLVEIEGREPAQVQWLDLPVPRELVNLEGELFEILSREEYAKYAEDWVSVRLTDVERPMDAMAKIQKRFPHCARVEYAPPEAVPTANYANLVAGKTEVELVSEFLKHVRGGDGLRAAELEIVVAALAELDGRRTR